MYEINDNTCDVPIIPIAGHLAPWSVDGWLIESKFVQGSYVVVADLNERNKLTDRSVYEERSALVNGQPVYVVSENKTYRWNTDSQDWFEDDLNIDKVTAEFEKLKNEKADLVYVNDKILQINTQIRDNQTQLNELKTSYETCVADLRNKDLQLQQSINEIDEKYANSLENLAASDILMDNQLAELKKDYIETIAQLKHADSDNEKAIKAVDDKYLAELKNLIASDSANNAAIEELEEKHDKEIKAISDKVTEDK